MDKIRDLELGEQIIGVSGILLLIDSFLPWYDVSVDFGLGTVSNSFNGWAEPNAFLSILAILIGVAMVAVLAIQNFSGVGLPDKLGTLSWAQGYMIAGIAAFALVLLKFLLDTDFTAIGLYLGLLFTAGLAAGGFLMMKGAEEGETPQGPATPPPPPQA